MKSKFILLAVALVGLQALGTASAQPKDTLQKIKGTGVINLGGRDASFPFSYKVSADSNPIGFSADLCMKVVDAVKATFKALIDETLTKVMKSGEIQELYAKWFTKPVPPAGVNLSFPMSNAVREAYRNPNNRGV